MQQNTIFDLKTTKSELSMTNSGMSNLRYREVQPLRNVVDGAIPAPANVTPLTKNFGNGEISLRWNLDEQTWFIPRESYLRMRCEIKYKTAAPALRNLLVSDGIAPSFGMMANMFNKMNIKCNNKQIESIDENIGQCEAEITRQLMSGEWKNKFGNSINWWNPDFNIRTNEISSDGIANDDVTIHDQLVEAAAASAGILPDFLDYTTPNTIQFIAAGAIIRFQASAAGANGAGFIDLRNYLNVGDRIYFVDAGGQKTATITGITQQDAGNNGVYNQITSSVAVADAAAAALIAQFRIAKLTPKKKYYSRVISSFEVCWKPLCMGFFNIPHAICGSNGRWEFELTPYSSYDIRALEGKIAYPVNTGAVNSVYLRVTDFRFYLKTCNGPRIEKIQYYIDMNKIKCSPETLTASTTTTKTIDIMPSTYALTLAFQDNRAGNSILYSPSLFKVNGGQERTLQRYSLRIANLSLPNPDAQYSYNTATYIDNLTEPYVRNSMYNGSYYDSSHETLKEWRDKLGLYLYHPFVRSGLDKESRCYVLTDFGGEANLTAAQCRILLFERYKSVCVISIDNSEILEVMASNS